MRFRLSITSCWGDEDFPSYFANRNIDHELIPVHKDGFVFYDIEIKDIDDLMAFISQCGCSVIVNRSELEIYDDCRE